MELTVLPQSAKQIASWNSSRDCWEADRIDLLSGRSDVYSETFPISGSMRNGVVYEHQMSGHRMEDFESLCSPQGGLLLPTPVAQHSGNSPENHLRKKPGRERVTDLAIIVENGLLATGGRLLPTPEAKLASSGPDYARMNRAGSGGHDLTTAVSLLPTPKAGDADFGLPRTSGRPPEKSTHLATRIAYTVGEELTPLTAMGFTDWGEYEPAIQRWEAIIGRPAPAPLVEGPKGGRELSALFEEWMMVLPESWVTGVEISHKAQKRMLGNGVVTQQALHALDLAEVAG